MGFFTKERVISNVVLLPIKDIVKNPAQPRVIFSKDDITLNGKGTLTIKSAAHGIVSKDDLKVTGGTLRVRGCCCAAIPVLRLLLRIR